MSRTGTGEPLFFHCRQWRLERTRVELNMLPSRPHRVELTGRIRAFLRYGCPSYGRRMDCFSREYRCSCGYVGWSRHNDLKRLERCAGGHVARETAIVASDPLATCYRCWRRIPVNDPRLVIEPSVACHHPVLPSSAGARDAQERQEQEEERLPPR